MSGGVTPGEWAYGVRSDGSIWLSLGDPKTGPHHQGDLVATPADAQLIISAPKLLAACEAQHKAIDALMAALIGLDRDFRPTKSAIWPAVLAGAEAIDQACAAPLDLPTSTQEGV